MIDELIQTMVCAASPPPEQAVPAVTRAALLHRPQAVAPGRRIACWLGRRRLCLGGPSFHRHRVRRMTVTTNNADPALLRLLIVDDQPLIRRGLAMMLATEPDIEIVGQAADGFEAIEQALPLGRMLW